MTAQALNVLYNLIYCLARNDFGERFTKTLAKGKSLTRIDPAMVILIEELAQPELILDHHAFIKRLWRCIARDESVNSFFPVSLNQVHFDVMKDWGRLKFRVPSAYVSKMEKITTNLFKQTQFVRPCVLDLFLLGTGLQLKNYEAYVGFLKARGAEPIEPWQALAVASPIENFVRKNPGKISCPISSTEVIEYRSFKNNACVAIEEFPLWMLGHPHEKMPRSVDVGRTHVLGVVAPPP